MNHKLSSQRVKHIRTKILKMSQSEFQTALNLKTKSTISMWENENLEKYPSRKLAIEISKLANVSVGYVLGEEEESEFDEIIEMLNTLNNDKRKKTIKLIKQLIECVK
ncbi:transcriptional regulator [Bacillus wiedmannii]|nr:helix-turn-helix transcriptional regulator [Bacillus wiedmannii]PFZ33852.1 transcriptional regulator [Bacillus wiedmannii]